MSTDNILNSDKFGEKIYSRFPARYQEDDIKQDYALKRFIFTANEGGFKYIIDDANGILNLIDPTTAPIEVVKLMYEQFGVPMFNGIPEEFLRSFLPNLGKSLDYRGTLTVIDYVASSITGVVTNSVVENDDTDNSSDLTITLELGGSRMKFFPDYNQFMEIMENFIPFYCFLYVVYNYNYSEEQFHVYVAHVVKYIETLYPNGPFLFDDPDSAFAHFVDENGNLLLDEEGNVLMEEYLTWSLIQNTTWGDQLSNTWEDILLQ